jgi:hypothetical protein
VVAVALTAMLLDWRFHHYWLAYGAQVAVGSPLHRLLTARIRGELLAHGFPETDAALGTLLAWQELLRKEAYVNALGDVFLVQMVIAGLALPLLLCLKRPREKA